MKPSQRRSKFYVVCVWCGVAIREDRHQDLEGMCLRCFYKIWRSAIKPSAEHGTVKVLAIGNVRQVH